MKFDGREPEPGFSAATVDSQAESQPSPAAKVARRGFRAKVGFRPNSGLRLAGHFSEHRC